MGIFIAERTISEMVNKNINPINAKVTIMGLAFKENCPDLRNTKVMTIIERLRDYNQIAVTDSCVLKKDAKDNLGIDLVHINDVVSQDALVIAVGHQEYCNYKIEDCKKCSNQMEL